MKIVNYCDRYESQWDNFVLEESMNGTFLQTRNFLNYHPEGRYKDCSLMIFEKDNIIAVIPACEIQENDKKVFFSHKGSTFGGIVIGIKYYNTKKLLELIKKVEEYIILFQFNKIELKITSNIFSTQPNELLEYILHYSKYKEYKELSTFISFEYYKDNIISNFNQGKRRNYNNCVKNGLVCKKLLKDEEILIFYNVLCENLENYGVKPVHTYNELIEFKNQRLKDDVEFWGCYLGENLVAGSMMFNFQRVGCIHAQYLCAKNEFNKLSPMTFLYYSMIKEAKERGFQTISWGIATEKGGENINMGLIQTKEAYGSQYSLNKTFVKML